MCHIMWPICLKRISASCSLCYTLPYAHIQPQKHIQTALCRLLLYMLLVSVCHKLGLVVLRGSAYGSLMPCRIRVACSLMPHRCHVYFSTTRLQSHASMHFQPPLSCHDRSPVSSNEHDRSWRWTRTFNSSLCTAAI